MGSKIIEFHNVSKAYPKIKLLNKFNYVFKTNDKIGIVGKNGTGKTTLLNLLTGEDTADSGKVIIGDTVAFGYYNQKGMKINDEHRVIDVVREIADIIPLKGGKKITAEQMLERFLFPRRMHRNFVYKLSGGEKKRLFLLTTLMKNPNFLILDEPTNDLDIFTLSILEEYLKQFPGVLVVVSHDRYFMDKLVDHLFVLDGNGNVKDYPGNYTLWREAEDKKVKIKTKSAGTKQEKKVKTEKPKTKLSFNERYEMEQLDKDIPKLEKEKEELELKLNSGEIKDHVEMTKITVILGELMKSIDEKTERWMELSEFE